MKSFRNFIVIMQYQTIKFNDSLFISLLQYSKDSTHFLQRKVILNFAFSSTKDLDIKDQMPKNQISVAESLNVQES